MKKKIDTGFTLIELLIVVSIIVLLLVIAFVALDPNSKFKEAKESRKWSDVSRIMSAVKTSQKSDGEYLYEFTYYNEPPIPIETGKTYMISSATTTYGCNSSCSIVSSDSACINASVLVNSGYLPNLPISPDGESVWSEVYTGYYFSKLDKDLLAVGACESENTDEIEVVR